MNDLFISEKNISLQKKSTTQVNAQCTLEIQLVQRLNLMTLVVMQLYFLYLISIQMPGSLDQHGIQSQDLIPEWKWKHLGIFL